MRLVLPVTVFTFRWTREGREYVLIDTAGVRRRSKVHETIEKFSVIKTLKAVEDCERCFIGYRRSRRYY